jgi:hypothetical protein
LWQECNTTKENDSQHWFLRNLMLSEVDKRDASHMLKQGAIAGFGMAALAAVAIAVAPAQGAPGKTVPRKTLITTPSGAGPGSFGFFTPAAADPRLAAIYARGAVVENDRFRFTPVNNGKRRALTVAVRASSSRAASFATVDRTQPVMGSVNIGLTPVTYSLGAAVGWKRFALSGDVSRINTGALPGGREAADLGISYNARKWSSRVQISAGSETYSLDVASSYRLTRNLDVTAGVRYRSDRDRLQVTPDQKRDSQAVYIGTSVRF